MVEWHPDALEDLAAIWLAATDRSAITVAAHAIDQTLSVDPDTVGRVVFDTVRQARQARVDDALTAAGESVGQGLLPQAGQAEQQAKRRRARRACPFCEPERKRADHWNAT